MGRILKFSGYITEMFPTWTAETLMERIKKFGCYQQHVHIESADFENSDHEEMFDVNCDLAYCEQFFKKEASAEEYDRPIPKIGEVWKHFKTGKQVKILAVSQDTEYPGCFSVVYYCPDGGIWNRPLDMFMSKTDKQKYPDATQEYRFVRVDHER